MKNQTENINPRLNARQKYGDENISGLKTMICVVKTVRFITSKYTMFAIVATPLLLVTLLMGVDITNKYVAMFMLLAQMACYFVAIGGFTTRKVDEQTRFHTEYIEELREMLREKEQLAVNEKSRN
jgi:hypothetical protein